MNLALPQHSNTSVENPASHRMQRSRRCAADDASQFAHDARNWLTVLGVYCDLLRSSGAINVGYEPWMDELAGAIERGRGLVEGLLDSLAGGEKTDRPIGRSVATANVQSIAERHPMRVARRRLASAESIDLTAALSRRLPVLCRMAGDRIAVEMSIPAHSVHVFLSEENFERVLYNLVLNAMQAMPTGGALRLELQCKDDRMEEARANNDLNSRKTALLRVSDSGGGIDPGRLPYIFEKGVSDKAVPSSGSRYRGLGLAIVRDLTERAGGNVRVRSEPGKGCQFEVDLPATT